jgi:hypothetical protein
MAQPRRTSGITVQLVFVAIVTAILALSLFEFVRSDNDADAYRSAGSCDVAYNDGDCRSEIAFTVDRIDYSGSSHHSGKTVSMALHNSSDDDYTWVQLSGSPVDEADDVSEGDAATGVMWHSKIVEVRVDGHTLPTVDSPDSQQNIMGISVGVMALVIFVLLRSVSRRRLWSMIGAKPSQSPYRRLLMIVEVFGIVIGAIGTLLLSDGLLLGLPLLALVIAIGAYTAFVPYLWIGATPMVGRATRLNIPLT